MAEPLTGNGWDMSRFGQNVSGVRISSGFGQLDEFLFSDWRIAVKNEELIFVDYGWWDGKA